MIAFLFALVPGLLAVWLIRRPAQALVRLLIVGLRPGCGLGLQAIPFYHAWFCILLCILANTLHPKLGLGWFLTFGAMVGVLVAAPEGVDCTGFKTAYQNALAAGLVVAAVVVFMPVCPPGSLLLERFR